MKLDELINFYYGEISAEERLQLRMILNSWGNKCFQAAREKDFTTTGDIDDIPGVVVSYKFTNFEDYLKQLDNDTKETN